MPDTLRIEPTAGGSTDILTLDGAYGEGGGQIVRSSLALSALTGTPCRIERVRAGRAKPGLGPQHASAARAIAEICDGRLIGDEVGSPAVELHPREIRPGDYRFAIGTAGSTTLVAQTILPALVCADGPSTVMLEGGTHNPMAPPFDFLERTYIPLLNQMGPTVTASLEVPGFAPAGGGRIRLEITPAPSGKLRGIELLERGKTRRRSARAVVSNLPMHIAERERAVLQSRFGWPPRTIRAEAWSDATGPGNVVLVEIETESHCEVFSSFGEIKKPAEAVAETVVRAARRYLERTAPVGEHLTDQLMLPLAIAGEGAFRSTGLSEHASTHLDLIALFLDTPVTREDEERGDVLLRFGS